MVKPWHYEAPKSVGQHFLDDPKMFIFKTFPHKKQLGRNDKDKSQKWNIPIIPEKWDNHLFKSLWPVAHSEQ